MSRRMPGATAPSATQSSTSSKLKGSGSGWSANTSAKEALSSQLSAKPLIRTEVWGPHRITSFRLAESGKPIADSSPKQKAHQLSAWGVLGSTTDGPLFSLLTLCFQEPFNY